MLSPFSPGFKKTVKTADSFLNIKNPFLKRFFLYFVYQQKAKQKLLLPNTLKNIKTLDTSDFYSGILDKAKNFESVTDKLAYLDLNSYTPDNLLTTANIAGMAHSLEIRVPLLDKRLIEFSFKIPQRLKLNRGITKYLFREIAADWLPRDVINHKKTGFGLPRISYMNGILKPQITECLSSGSVEKRGIFAFSEVNRILKNFYSTDQTKMLWTEHLKVWILFIFEMWAREYLD